jgi:hypothetical protein
VIAIPSQELECHSTEIRVSPFARIRENGLCVICKTRLNHMHLISLRRQWPKPYLSLWQWRSVRS